MFRQAIQRWSAIPTAHTLVAARQYADAAGAQAATLHARLKADLKAAMKAKEKEKLTVIKGILSDILYAEKSSSGQSFSKESDADVAAVIQRAIKQRHDSIQSYRDGGREDLASAEKAEAELLKAYLPDQLTSEQIEAQVKQVIERLGVSGIKAMGAVMREVDISPAQAPKSKVAEAVKKLLAGA
ncbi:hypothetical protein GGI12_000825 [Dipsacomyces acuminosporus]|nr:hypothetical protein GGI12_000825 [Dipsacomyces acuminosporus]